jgi:recombinational DNA repair ATPase RecF
MTPEIEQRVVDRLIDSGNENRPWALLVLAAMEGDEPLASLLAGRGTVARPNPTPASARVAVEPPGAYVRSITVEGFRGVGRSATLALRAGPGLTLVVGRNGSGKSSFAEGLEYLLTGRNYRWEKRPKAWLEGWRNLHYPRPSLNAEVIVEGKGLVKISRAWKGDALAAHEIKCAGPSKEPVSLESLGWDTALVTFRPFLSYNELGSLLEEGPSKLYDALSGVLGLDEIVAVQTRLAAARKARQAVCDEAAEGAEAIAEVIDRVAESGEGDTRLERARTALAGKAWDLETLASLTDSGTTEAAPEIDLLRRIESIAPVDVEGVSRAVERLRSTAAAMDDLAGSNAERSRQRAELLEQALRFHERHRVSDCPVCGTKGVLAGRWATASADEIKRLRKEAGACQAATEAARTALREAQRFVTSPPPLLAEAKDLGLSGLPNLRRLWIDWAAGRDVDDPRALADRLESRVLDLADALEKLLDEAAAERSRREDAWRPIASAIQTWLPVAREAAAAKSLVKQIKTAEDWWKETSASIRDERFAPIADRARAVWTQLRLQSNVNLGAVVLEGTAGRRRVALQVTVDDTPAEALGVMSQGELHSLALSLFLPRATLPESPFRFICIDDPVQSMDPARVEGLARTLADAAKTRQVIVFTHDDRLSEAVRRLGLPAMIHSVTRRAKSAVEVRQVSDPVSSLIADARALAATDDLPPDVAARVVPGFCRAAVEASCMEAVRRRRLTRGEQHEAVEVLLAGARTHPLMALALFDDDKRSEEVMPRLKKIGTGAVEVFKMCKAGAHERHEGDLKLLIDNAERLATHIQEKL